MDRCTSTFCCGVGEIGNFYGDVTLQSEENCVRFTGKSLATAQADLDYYLKTHVSTDRGLVTATTLAATQKIVGKWLEERGFKDTLHFRGRDCEGAQELILWTKVLKEV